MKLFKKSRVVHITVTQEDIDEGVPYDPYGSQGGCMVWRAMNREMGEPEGLAVASTWIGAARPAFAFKPSQKLYDAIRAFDSGEKVEPFEFNFTIK